MSLSNGKPGSGRLVQLTFSDPITLTTNTLLIDATVNEQHQVNAQVTDHQVEKGASVTDHVRPLPRRLTLDAIITNTPITTVFSQPLALGPFVGDIDLQGGLSATGVLQFRTEFDRAQSSYDLLSEAALNGAVFQVFTTLASYDDMIAVNLSVPRNVDSGNSLQFTLDMQQLNFVEVLTGQALPPSIKQKKTSRGHQQPPVVEKPAETAAVKRASLLTRVGKLLNVATGQ